MRETPSSELSTPRGSGVLEAGESSGERIETLEGAETVPISEEPLGKKGLFSGLFGKSNVNTPVDDESQEPELSEADAQEIEEILTAHPDLTHATVIEEKQFNPDGYRQLVDETEKKKAVKAKQPGSARRGGGKKSKRRKSTRRKSTRRKSKRRKSKRSKSKRRKSRTRRR